MELPINQGNQENHANHGSDWHVNVRNVEMCKVLLIFQI